ncbi:MAG: PepSY domain-containing protein [Paracoccus sp. (in: a-proteobacteria)]|nr:PepSY domain-containing protein [Paracoccus sp. (in: a-proteobacteria)]
MATGQGVAPADPNQTERWLTNLHRSLFLEDGGRIAMAAGAAAMLVLSLSGAALVARRAGGWRHWFARLRRPLAGRLHVEIARIAVIGLLLSSTTALWMTASTFNLLRDDGNTPTTPTELSGTTGFAPAQMAALRQTPVTELRELSFPCPGDATVVFTLRAERGTGYLDQGDGTLLIWTDLTGWQRISETIYMLHTGQGAAVLGLLLGLMALGVPAMGVTGVLIWLAGRRGRVRVRRNQPAGRAGTVLLVGSEGGSRWRFAATLHAALTQAGQSAHVGPMSGFVPDRYSKAQRLILLAATCGDGAAPASAKGFLERLNASERVPNVPMAVLGFGDRRFPACCAFVKTVAAAILRFALPRASVWQRLVGRGFARFQAGDLIGLLPEGSAVPRLYSLASGRRDGFVEIMVRKHPGGLSSGQLTALEPDDRISAFLRPTSGFRPGRSGAPLILIGAGTGIGPLAGFVRGNARRGPVHLLFGMRDPDSDFFYGDELAAWQGEGRLTRLVPAVSRGARPHYVQDALRCAARPVRSQTSSATARA